MAEGEQEQGQEGGAETQVAEGQQESQGGEQEQGAARGSRYEQRVQQLANETRAAKEEAARARREVEEIRKQNAIPAEQAEAQRKQRERDEKFYKAPPDYVDTRVDTAVSATEQRLMKQLSQFQDSYDFNSHNAALRSSPEFGPELEQKMVGFLQRHGLTDPDKLAQVGRTNALRIAYEGATGRQWGDWGRNSYSARQTKENLMRPGGGGSPGAAMMDPDAYRAATRALAHRNMSQEEQSIEAQKLDAKLEAWYAANQR